MTFTFARAFVDANGVNLPQPYSRAMEVIEIVGRDGRIRTCDPHTPSITLGKNYINVFNGLQIYQYLSCRVTASSSTAWRRTLRGVCEFLVNIHNRVWGSFWLAA